MVRYDKLVRDRIPEIVRGEGRTPRIRTLAEEEYVLALQRKLVEEASEVARATRPDDIALELADVLEVLHALASALGIPEEQINAIGESRARQRGRFAQRIWLESVED